MDVSVMMMDGWGLMDEAMVVQGIRYLCETAEKAGGRSGAGGNGKIRIWLKFREPIAKRDGRSPRCQVLA
jgi:hypothetical protein